jgi:hypothetical protein
LFWTFKMVFSALPSKNIRKGEKIKGFYIGKSLSKEKGETFHFGVIVDR